MKKVMKIRYRKQNEKETAPWQQLNNIDEILWDGRYDIHVENYDTSMNLPFTLNENETATLIVEDYSHNGKLQPNRTTVQRISKIDQAIGELQTYYRTYYKVDGNHQWSEWKQGATSVDNPGNESTIIWNSSSHIDTYTTAGIFDITGERTNAADGLPIANASPGHTIHARLVVLDSSIPGNGQADDKCITQILTLSNRTGGDGDVYVRTGRAANKNQLAGGNGWELWGKLQQNIEVGQVTSLNDFTSNGVYSGVYTNGPSLFETFVMVVINNYAVAGATGKVRSISQFKYALGTDGTFSHKTRTGEGNTGISWGEWVDLGAATTADIQDNSITAQKLSADVRARIETQQSMPAVKKFLTLPTPSEIDDDYNKIGKISLSILGQQEDFFKLQAKQNGGALARTFYLKDYSVNANIPVHFVSYIYSEKEQEICYQLYENSVGYLQNQLVRLNVGWNKLEIEHTFETITQNLLYLYLGKLAENEFYFYKTFVYNGIVKANIIMEHTNDELSTRLIEVENVADRLQGDIVDKIIYDNEDLVFLGKGTTYDYQSYEIAIEGDSVFIIKIANIVLPEGATFSPALRLEFYDETGSKLLDNQFNKTTDTVITAPVGTVKLRYTFMKSTSPASILDGEYKFNGVTLIQKAKISARIVRVENRVADLEMLSNDWSSKVLSTYGDSVTALQGGDFSYPYNLTNTQRWGNRVADYFKMSKHYGRGIGGQKYAWGTNGGSITWVYKDTGIMYNRNDAFNLDNWDGSSFPSTWTEAQKNIVLNGLADGSVVSIRGCACSWLRITSMYPASIKDSIDAVFVMFHNDSVDGNEFAWVEGDTTDPEWAASEQYATYGGDYNISTLEGGIASTIMKLQAWMPNAVIILGTPINGQGATGQLRPDANGLYKQVQHVKNVGLRFSIPVIDVYATCGINGLNRTEYITDSVHPYSVAGSKMIARAIIGGLKTILPNGIV